MFLPDAKRNYWGAISVCDEFNGTLLSIHSVEVFLLLKDNIFDKATLMFFNDIKRLNSEKFI